MRSLFIGQNWIYKRTFRSVRCHYHQLANPASGVLNLARRNIPYSTAIFFSPRQIPPPSSNPAIFFTVIAQIFQEQVHDPTNKILIFASMGNVVLVPSYHSSYLLTMRQGAKAASKRDRKDEKAKPAKSQLKVVRYLKLKRPEL